MSSSMYWKNVLLGTPPTLSGYSLLLAIVNYSSFFSVKNLRMQIFLIYPCCYSNQLCCRSNSTTCHWLFFNFEKTKEKTLINRNNKQKYCLSEQYFLTIAFNPNWKIYQNYLLFQDKHKTFNFFNCFSITTKKFKQHFRVKI